MLMNLIIISYLICLPYMYYLFNLLSGMVINLGYSRMQDEIDKMIGAGAEPDYRGEKRTETERYGLSLQTSLRSNSCMWS